MCYNEVRDKWRKTLTCIHKYAYVIIFVICFMYLCVGAYYPECTHSLYVQCSKGARFPAGPHVLLYCLDNIPNYLPHCLNYNILIILGKFTDLTLGH